MVESTTGNFSRSFAFLYLFRARNPRSIRLCAVAPLASGTRVTRPFELNAEIRPDAFFIVGGQISFVADMDEIFTNA